MMKTNATKRTFTHALSWVLSLVVVWAICLSCITAFAEDAKTFEQTLVVEQTIEGNANRTKYTYVLTPRDAENPMPEGTKDGKYTFELDGNEKHTMALTFPADKAVNYQYDLTRVEEVPAGDTVTPATHLFGYLVEQDSKTGGLVIIPYTCYDSKMEIWNKVDADGNPLGITLVNGLKGTPTQSSSSTTSSTSSKSTTNTTGRSTTSSTGTTRTYTNTIKNIVNTGDPHHIVIWVTLVALSAIGLIIVAFARRKKDNDEENH